MNATAALTAVPSTETFGLPPEASHLIAKLRQMSPEQRATIIHTKEHAA
ncbi:hypothetical protein SEA_RADFAD_66 [Arthrobacter phage RadFad]|nr:hypothetical protein SEA_RADFAD_66 [Arthrobacter phage RadFad]